MAKKICLQKRICHKLASSKDLTINPPKLRQNAPIKTRIGPGIKFNCFIALNMVLIYLFIIKSQFVMIKSIDEAVDKIKEELIDKKINLHDLAKKNKVTVTSSENKQNKGWAGLSLHRFLGDYGNEQLPDFSWGELKTFPIIKYKNKKGYRVKETAQITMTSKEEILSTNFKNSHLLNKLSKVLFIARSVGHNFKDPSYVLYVRKFDLKDDFYNLIEEDYFTIKNFIKNNNKVESKIGTFIQCRTKGAGKKSKKTRAFYLKTKFLKKLFNL